MGIPFYNLERTIVKDLIKKTLENTRIGLDIQNVDFSEIEIDCDFTQAEDKVKEILDMLTKSNSTKEQLRDKISELSTMIIGYFNIFKNQSSIIRSKTKKILDRLLMFKNLANIINNALISIGQEVGLSTMIKTSMVSNQKFISNITLKEHLLIHTFTKEQNNFHFRDYLNMNIIDGEDNTKSKLIIDHMYDKYIQNEQVQFQKYLIGKQNDILNLIYFNNSGTSRDIIIDIQAVILDKYTAILLKSIEQMQNEEKNPDNF